MTKQRLSKHSLSRPAPKFPINSIRSGRLLKFYLKKEENASTDCSSEKEGTGENPGRRLMIFWKGKIIHPSYRQLMEFKGNLNELLAVLGGSEPSPRERRFRKIRIEWKGRVLWATPFQILQAKGNIFQLEKIMGKDRYDGQFRGSNTPSNVPFPLKI